MTVGNDLTVGELSIGGERLVLSNNRTSGGPNNFTK